MAYYDSATVEGRPSGQLNHATVARPGRLFRIFKRSFDISAGIVLLGTGMLYGVFIILLNPLLNPGPLFFVQSRMGRNGAPFRMIKFRTMSVSDTVERSAECPLEVGRITPFGCILRKLRIDELPQAINVLRGEMSIIGPRPDYIEHAEHFVKTVPGYRDRHVVRPGISGLAQTEVGYVEGSEATQAKVGADLHYIANLGFKIEAYIIFRSFMVIIGRAGS